MRRVYITGNPPQDWIDDAKQLTQDLNDAIDKAKRDEIIEKKQGLWRDDRIRNWLLNQFNNKCWYTEAYDSVSSIHVDHYRPKGRIKDLDGSIIDEGYWWLAFKWENYRMCGQLINVKKQDVFPYTDGIRANSIGTISLALESPLLIDPLTDQTRLITYEQDEETCIAVPAACLDAPDAYKATKTIEILGLNRLSRLNQKRREFWDECLMTIKEYQGADGPQALREVIRGQIRLKLKKMVSYKEEFSSISEACIRKNAPESLIASVFENRV